jgi:hypothetical protein
MTHPSRMTDFEVQPVSAERSAKLLEIHDLAAAHIDRQLQAGVPFNPGEHPDGSDYNLHAAALEASGEAEDDFAAAAAEILDADGDPPG